MKKIAPTKHFDLKGLLFRETEQVSHFLAMTKATWYQA